MFLIACVLVQQLNAPGGNYGQPGAQDIAHLLEINNANLSRLPNGGLGNRVGLGPGLAPPQVRPPASSVSLPLEHSRPTSVMQKSSKLGTEGKKAAGI